MDNIEITIVQPTVNIEITIVQPTVNNLNVQDASSINISVANADTSALVIKNGGNASGATGGIAVLQVELFPIKYK